MSERRHLLGSGLLLVLLGTHDSSWAAGPLFPGEVPGTNLAGGLPRPYEASGGCWHPRLEQLFQVHDGGVVPSTVSRMNADGTGVTNWQVPGDLEGITYADPATDLVYLGLERPVASVKEFDFVEGKVTRTFDLSPWIGGDSNSLIEALTFVPDPSNPEGGLFYAGHQGEGAIYLFELSIRSSRTATRVRFVRKFTPVSGRADLAGLDWDPVENVLYASWDTGNHLRKMTADGTFLAEWNLPGHDQEGIAVRPCQLFVSEDQGQEVWRYRFATTAQDDDADGVTNCRDDCEQTVAGAMVDPNGCPAAPECSVAADCDDGGSCNGAETCEAGVCAPGPAPDCDDGLACTWDSCDEASDSCLATADHASCDDGNASNGQETCDASIGCLPGRGQHIIAGGDYDGDSVSDLAVFRAGRWLVKRSTDGGRTDQVWGRVGDLPVPGDYDGDGRADLAVFREGLWIVRGSSDGARLEIVWGTRGDYPVPGDYDGDGRVDLAVYRVGRWIVRCSADGSRMDQGWGGVTDRPVPADYDGDRLHDLAVYRAGRWIIRRSGDRVRQEIAFGLADDTVAPHDYDGDDRADAAVFRGGRWLIRRSSDQEKQEILCGAEGDRAVPLRRDGDGRADPAAFRDGLWTVLPSTSGELQEAEWGQPGDDAVSH